MVFTPVLAIVQLVPLLGERNTPLGVPAKRFEPFTVRAFTLELLNPPELTDAQVVPKLVERNIPPPFVPA